MKLRMSEGVVVRPSMASLPRLNIDTNSNNPIDLVASSESGDLMPNTADTVCNVLGISGIPFTPREIIQKRRVVVTPSADSAGLVSTSADKTTESFSYEQGTPKVVVNVGEVFYIEGDQSRRFVGGLEDESGSPSGDGRTVTLDLSSLFTSKSTEVVVVVKGKDDTYWNAETLTGPGFELIAMTLDDYVLETIYGLKASPRDFIIPIFRLAATDDPLNPDSSDDYIIYLREQYQVGDITVPVQMLLNLSESLEPYVYTCNKGEDPNWQSFKTLHDAAHAQSGTRSNCDEACSGCDEVCVDDECCADCEDCCGDEPCQSCDDGVCSNCDEGPCINGDYGPCSNCDEGACNNTDGGQCTSCDDGACIYCDQLGNDECCID